MQEKGKYTAEENRMGRERIQKRNLNANKKTKHTENKWSDKKIKTKN